VGSQMISTLDIVTVFEESRLLRRFILELQGDICAGSDTTLNPMYKHFCTMINGRGLLLYILP
jgi:hypothetical protein